MKYNFKKFSTDPPMGVASFDDPYNVFSNLLTHEYDTTFLSDTIEDINFVVSAPDCAHFDNNSPTSYYEGKSGNIEQPNTSYSVMSVSATPTSYIHNPVVTVYKYVTIISTDHICLSISSVSYSKLLNVWCNFLLSGETEEDGFIDIEVKEVSPPNPNRRV